MALRRKFAWVAIATLGLIISNVSVGRALTFCDIYPNRCQYTPSGKGYYYPLGYRLPSETPGFGRGNVASGQAWGCVATDGRNSGRSWGMPNRSAASYGALLGCTKLGGQCHVVSCSASIRSRYEAHAVLLVHR
jgi:hypothetical protein